MERTYTPEFWGYTFAFMAFRILALDSPSFADTLMASPDLAVRERRGVFPFTLGSCAEGTGTYFFFFSFLSFSSFPPAAIPHPFVKSCLCWPQRKWVICRPSLSWEADSRGEKEQPSSPPLSAFSGYLSETQSAASGRYPPFSRRGGIPPSSGFPPRFLEGILWVLIIPLNTSVASFTLSFRWPGLFISNPVE